MKAEISWLDDPETFRVNQLPARSDHRGFQSTAEATTRQSSLEQSLDGDWQFQFAQTPQERPVGFYDPDYDRTHFDTITVPGHIEIAGYGQLKYINTTYPWEGKDFRRPAYALGDGDTGKGMFSEGEDNTVGAYVTNFILNPALRDKRVIVQFDGVEEAMYLWLNGQFVGYAEDSFSRSEFDLTPYLKDGDNLMAVEVFKRSTAAFIEDQDMFRFSGIFRSVRLVGKPAVFLEDLAIRPDVSADYTDGKLNLALKLSQTDDAPAAEIRVKVTDGDGREVLSLTKPAAESVTFENNVFKKVHLWNHMDPYLYHLQIELTTTDGTTLEVVPYDFGFRKVELKNKIMLLNGNRIIINGVNRHEWDAKQGRAVTDEDMHYDMQVFHDNNINAVRTCHYPDQIPWYFLCDHEGIYMMAENNLESHGSWQKMGAVEPSYNVPGSVPQWKAAVIDRARSNYEAFKNHTAVLFWSLGNESYAGDDIAAMNKFYKDHDDTRLTHYEGVCRNRKYEDQISDMESMMYDPPVEIAKYLENDPKKPFVNCEYMHDMGNSLGGMSSYDALIDKYPMYQGGFIWDYIDQALWTEDEVTGEPVLRYGGDFDDRHSDYEFSGDGLLFADRTPKPAMQEVKYYYGKHIN
ncbi:beta-galactosidase [Secundilactobacillus paracollinoides]|uniref:glycoside hydrolase family 2 TIM barrel-domain containing protein n=1 Tax=Secundilactobacillus paracollinoides TaxID=240427 RepID=UPI00081A6190|nr:glycoside hydrolase family 2 TIM barrel-domain containing protein [Secundilactobacillus paracollinoides]ANZ62964.1 beta-galactosidase [Secundilactobacillus paracollinoides]